MNKTERIFHLKFTESERVKTDLKYQYKVESKRYKTESFFFFHLQMKTCLADLLIMSRDLDY